MTTPRGRARVKMARGVLVSEPLASRSGILRILDLAPVDDPNRLVSAHDAKLCP